MNVLAWHVHGSWMTAFVQGSHRYYVPVVPDRGPDGRGRAQTWDWPQSVVEIKPHSLREEKFDAIVLQRPHEYELARQMFGITPGVDVPAIYVEHNAPQGLINQMRHPLADVPGLSFVHVTHFNDLFWDCGESPTCVIEHGVVDPGYRYTGEVAKAAVVINEPERRARVTGTDLVERISSSIPLELFGMGAAARGGFENLRQSELHEQLPKRRVYFHPIRWTSLGLSLIEAMHLGMPVVALATTEIPEAVPDDAGITSTNVRSLADGLRDLLQNPAKAKTLGLRARAHARERYGLERFLRDWDNVFEDTVC
ncbi:MAG: glycosyltransferase family 4 protein [Candidatus Eremiobacteraeota bacterium]|nr:glycosyltransferase family 4 protein [Candidatus Eremiobacteraeota bacterium]